MLEEVQRREQAAMDAERRRVEDEKERLERDEETRQRHKAEAAAMAAKDRAKKASEVEAARVAASVKQKSEIGKTKHAAARTMSTKPPAADDDKFYNPSDSEPSRSAATHTPPRLASRSSSKDMSSSEIDAELIELKTKDGQDRERWTKLKLLLQQSRMKVNDHMYELKTNRRLSKQEREHKQKYLHSLEVNWASSGIVIRTRSRTVVFNARGRG